MNCESGRLETDSPTKSKNNTSHPLSSPPPFPPVPRPLTVENIEEYMQLYATAARNVVLGAGFDGEGICVANLYLADQFLQSNSDQRSDFYGGPVQNRVRFVLEVHFGANGVGIRLGSLHVPRNEDDKDPIGAMLGERDRVWSALCVRPHVVALTSITVFDNKQLRHKTKGSDFGHDSAIDTVEKEGVPVLFARHLLSLKCL